MVENSLLSSPIDHKRHWPESPISIAQPALTVDIKDDIEEIDPSLLHLPSLIDVTNIKSQSIWP